MSEPTSIPQIACPPAADSHAGFAAAFRSFTFCVLWLSEAISLIGDRILMVALINLVYERTGSAASVGLLSMIKALPALLLGTLAGAFVDRWYKKWTMVFSNLILFALVLLIPHRPVTKTLGADWREGFTPLQSEPKYCVALPLQAMAALVIAVFSK